MALSTEEIQEKVEAVALPLLAQAGVDLVELHIGRHKSNVLVQFTADLPGGGITMQQCASLNRAIVDAIDRDGFLGDDYALEFSSPGLDRPLKTFKDFQRNLGRPVRFWLSAPVEGKAEWTGVLTAAAPGALTVMLKKNKEIVLPLGQVIKGVQVI